MARMINSVVVLAILLFFRTARVTSENEQFPFVENARTSPMQAEYDYIVVGSDPTGCPLAVTLSQHFSVLLLEHGGASLDRPDNDIQCSQLSGTKTGGAVFDAADDHHTAAELLQYADPHRIGVLVYATTHQITFTLRGSANDLPKATGVSYADEFGQQHQARISSARESDILLSSGPIEILQLFFLSGFGLATNLGQFNIRIMEDQPTVAQRSENSLVTTRTPSRYRVDNLLVCPTVAEDSSVCSAGILSSMILHIESSSTLSSDYHSEERVHNFTRTLSQFQPETIRPRPRFSRSTGCAILVCYIALFVFVAGLTILGHVTTGDAVDVHGKHRVSIAARRDHDVVRLRRTLGSRDERRRVPVPVVPRHQDYKLKFPGRLPGGRASEGTWDSKYWTAE